MPGMGPIVGVGDGVGFGFGVGFAVGIPGMGAIVGCAATPADALSIIQNAATMTREPTSAVLIDIREVLREGPLVSFEIH
jgi:hypothetical protein